MADISIMSFPSLSLPCSFLLMQSCLTLFFFYLHFLCVVSRDFHAKFFSISSISVCSFLSLCSFLLGETFLAKPWQELVGKTRLNIGSEQTSSRSPWIKLLLLISFAFSAWFLLFSKQYFFWFWLITSFVLNTVGLLVSFCSHTPYDIFDKIAS